MYLIGVSSFCLFIFFIYFYLLFFLISFAFLGGVLKPSQSWRLSFAKQCDYSHASVGYIGIGSSCSHATLSLVHGMI